MSEIIIGIDLGTSTTEAAVLRDGEPTLLLNFQGNKITPSVIGIDSSGSIIVGERAKAQLLLEPKNTVMEVKRAMGTSDRIPLGSSSYTPEELSSMILSYVKRYSQEALGEEVTKVVISVPAYFNEIQRQATVEAGKKAGLYVERIINEPTAAALAYGMEHMEEESHILVYDLGGGTFDVTLLEFFGGIAEVKASSGDNKLGGKDFDEAIIEYLIKEFYDKHDISLEEDVLSMVKLKEAAEKCKVVLSCEEVYTIKIPVIIEKDGVSYPLEETLTRELFESLIKGLVERTHNPIKRVLADGEVAPGQLDLILLVGGSTRIPYISRDIEEFLGKSPKMLLNPDYAVAEGAAIMAGIINGELKKEDSILLTDVNPFTLGIRAIHGYDIDYMSIIIPRNTTIPVVKREIYYTIRDNQKKADIEVYQGESKDVTENEFLGTFTIGGIPKAPAGRESIEVSFAYNVNGMLTVEAKIVSTGEKASLDIDMTGVSLYIEEDIDVDSWKSAKEAKKYRTTIRRVEKLIGSGMVDEEVEELLYDLKVAIVKGSSEAEDIELELLKILE